MRHFEDAGVCVWEVVGGEVCARLSSQDFAIRLFAWAGQGL